MEIFSIIYLRLSIHFPSRHVKPFEQAGYKINKTKSNTSLFTINIHVIFVKEHKLQRYEKMFFSAIFYVNSKLLYY